MNHSTNEASKNETTGKEQHASGFIYIAAAISALGGRLFGYETGVISGPILFIREDFALSPGGVEFVISCVLIGALPGAILSLGMLWLPESPCWLVGQNSTDAARKILQRLSYFTSDPAKERTHDSTQKFPTHSCH